MTMRDDLPSGMSSSDQEFVILVEALSDLETNLFQIAGAMETWLNEAGIDSTTLESLVMSEILEIVGAVSDRPIANDDVLAGLLLFILQADLSDDPIELRKLFATIAQPGVSTVFDDEQDLFVDSDRINSITRPSRFVFNIFLTFDKLLIQFGQGPQFVEMYLGAFASFVAKVMESSVLVGDTAQVLFRSGTFCAARLQLQEFLLSSPLDDLKHAEQYFQFDFGDINAFESLKCCVAFSVRLNDEYMEALASMVDSLISLVLASRTVLDNDHHAEGSATVTTSSSKTPKERIVELRELLASGLITQSEYERKREQIVEGI